MLTILWRIITILGIILLCLFGLFLIVLILILFLPVSYRFDGKRDISKMECKLKARWLFGLARLDYWFPDPGRLVVKLLWFSIFDSRREPKEKKEKKPPKKKKRRQRKDPDSNLNPSDEYEALIEKAQTTSPQLQDKQNPLPEDNTEHGTEKEKETDFSINRGQDSWSDRLNHKITEKVAKIKYTIGKICDRIKNISEHIEYYRKLLAEEETKLLFGDTFLRLMKILKSIHPRKLNADITFGTGSPDTTGYLLGIYCMLSPVLGKNINIIPDFDEMVLTGEIHASGRIMSVVLLNHALRLLTDKRLRLFLRKMNREEV